MMNFRLFALIAGILLTVPSYAADKPAEGGVHRFLVISAGWGNDNALVGQPLIWAVAKKWNGTLVEADTAANLECQQKAPKENADVKEVCHVIYRAWDGGCGYLAVWTKIGLALSLGLKDTEAKANAEAKANGGIKPRDLVGGCST
jgi:hypothetical protein